MSGAGDTEPMRLTGEGGETGGAAIGNGLGFDSVVTFGLRCSWVIVFACDCDCGSDFGRGTFGSFDCESNVDFKSDTSIWVGRISTFCVGFTFTTSLGDNSVIGFGLCSTTLLASTAARGFNGFSTIAFGFGSTALFGFVSNKD